MPLQADVHDAIVRAATEEGIDPAYALAVAERESSFNPTARSSRSIYGLFQMSGGLRSKYGSGDSDDPYTQARAFSRFTRDLQTEMAGHLGRDPTYAETYAGHYWGGARGARMIGNVDPDTPVSHVFTPYERSLNPNIDRAGTTGTLTSSVLSDMDRRMAKYGGGGGAQPGFSHLGDEVQQGFSHLGEPIDQPEAGFAHLGDALEGATDASVPAVNG